MHRSFPSFWLKSALAVALAALADLLFWPGAPGGATVGVFALALAGAAVLAQPAIRRDRRAVVAMLIAAGLGLVLIDYPNLVGWWLFAVAIGVAVTAVRIAPGTDALAWAGRLGLAGVLGLVGPLLDLIKLRRWRRGPKRRWLVHAPQLILPLVGGAVFLGLFAFANPVLSDSLQSIDAGELDFARVVFWGAVLLAAWMVLRPRLARWPRAAAMPKTLERPGVTVISVGLSLVLFNLLFAVQNGLDIAFLWSGARLPGQVTMADYAHRGAYTLILTAILAGAFVLFALRPHSTTGRSRPLRLLVVAWVAQNLVLVASSMLRTWDYVQAYGLTRLRCAALIWMVLVGIGLVLICWRLLRGRSSGWLINANTAAAGLALAACAVVDLGALSAGWNVRHAAEVGGSGVQLDLPYLVELGPAAAVPLSELDHRPLPPAFRARVEDARSEVLIGLERDQANWQSWSWRGQRRLDRAQSLRPPGGLTILAAEDSRLTRTAAR